MKMKESRGIIVQRERIINDDPKLIGLFGVGSVAHQGDLILVSIGRLPGSAKPRKNRQLAEGTTQGSRHILARGKLYNADASEVAELILAATGCLVETQYIGPVFVSPAKPSANDLTHPEHGNIGVEAGALVAVVYQRSLDAEERAASVID